MNYQIKLITLFLVLTLNSFIGYGQSKLITGVVVDNEGTSLPGVSVLVLGTNNGTVTSIDGKYVLNNVNPADTIQFSFIGYESQNKFVDGKSIINVILDTGTEELEEVQIVAFQKQKKESVIGSINTIKPKDLKQPTSNLTTALAGRMSGIIAYQRSGEPGKDNAEFFIRGVTSFGYKNSPLILIDGLEVSSEDLARIEPDNIASFSIMKDATATSLYGARGANGVVLITTKEGRKGKAKVAFRYETNIAEPTRTNKFLSGVEYMELYNEALRTRYPTASLRYSKTQIEGTRNGLNSDAYPNVDWYNELFKNSTVNSKANLNVNGGGEVATYYLSASYTNENGLLKVDDLNNFNNNINIDRYNLRANVNIKLTKTTKALVKFSSLFDKYNGPLDDANGIFESVMNANPVNFPKYFEKDSSTHFLNHILFGNQADGSYPNPYADMVKGYKDRFSSTIMSQIQIEQDLGFLLKGLTMRGLASIRSYSSNENRYWYDPFYYRAIGQHNEFFMLQQIVEGSEYLNNHENSSDANSNLYFEGIAQYDRNFAEKHSVGGLFVFYRSEALNTISDWGDANLEYMSSFPTRNLGLSGRLTYGFDSRYLLELNFGYNGSEKFAKNHRFGFFPSVGGGWIVSNENFWTLIKPTISMFKLKYTYGLVGNDAISDPNDRFFYLSNANLSDDARGYTFGRDFNNYYSGYNVSRYSNPDVTWEIAYKSNYGVELELFSKALFQVDYFTEKRENIYMKLDYVPETMGSTADISSNVGRAESHGIDASLDINHAFSGDFWISSRSNFTYATNKILENGEPEYEYEHMSRIGYPINQPRGYVAERLFIDDEEAMNSPNQFDAVPGLHYGAGDIKYVDVNEDGKIGESDMVPIGFPSVPEIVYGFGASVGYKGLDFSFFFQGSARQSFFIRTVDDWENGVFRLGVTPFTDEGNALKIIADNHWSEDNPDPYAFWPRLSTDPVSTDNPGNNYYPSTWWLRDGSFLRLKSLELGYSLPDKISNKAKISNIRMYFNGINILTFSKFNLWDPEMAGNGLGYPTQRVYNLGIQVTL